MAVETLYTTGFTQDGDSLRDGAEFQPARYEDDVEDMLSVYSEVADLLEKAYEQEKSLTNKLAFLSEDVRTELAQTKVLKEEVYELDQLQREMYDTDSLKPLQCQIEDLNKEWEVIVKERKPLESGHNIQGDLGTVAVYVEQAMCAYVLPQVFLNNDKASLRNLLKYLNGNNKPFPLDPKKYNCEGILSDARNKWEILCKNFNFPNAWKITSDAWAVDDCTIPADIRAIEVLKECGVSINFPSPVSLKCAEQNVESLKDELPPWQFKLVSEFIGSLREKITRTGLHHNNLDLD